MEENFPELLWTISIIMSIQSFAKNRTHYYSHRNKRCYPPNIYENVKLLQLKTLIKETLPETGVTFSTSTIRLYDGKAALTVRHLYDHLVDLNMDILDHKNITGKLLVRKGIHLKKPGSN